MNAGLSNLPVRIPRPGDRAGKVAKWLLVSSLILLIILSSIGTWLPGLSSFFASLFPSTTPEQSQASCPNIANFITTVGQCSPPASSPASNTPNSVGADPMPNLSLPKTVLSSLSSLISDGGVAQDSPQNLTLYNLDLSMRLLGGPRPNDQILGSDHRILAPLSFWSVQVNASGEMIPLIPTSSSFTLLGTNSSGTSVARTMNLESAQYSGKFVIIYTVTPSGPLKWDLLFTPIVTGNYQITYEWQHGTHDSVLQADAKTFTAEYRSENFTLKWGDIPSIFGVKPTLSLGEFSLAVGLGTIAAGHQISIDPTIASSVGSGATAFTFQRKIVYNSQSGYYFAFYHNGQTAGYSSSPNGTTWSAQRSMAPGWPGYNSTDFELSVLSAGQTVIVTAGESSTAGCLGNCAVGVHPYVVYAMGTMSGSSINWQPTHHMGTVQPTCSSNGSVWCYITAGYRYVSTILSPNGTLVFSYNYFEIHQSDTQYCTNLQTYELSNLIMNYSNHILVPQVVSGCTGTGYNNPPFANADNDRSILIPADAYGKIRIFYQYAGSNSAPSLYTTWYDGSTQGPTDTLQTTVPDNDQLSAVADANYGQHLVYTLTNGTVSYAYRASLSSPQWVGSSNIFGLPVTSPTISVDFSTDIIYVVGVTPGPGGQGYYLIMKSKSLSQNWSDEQASYPVTSSTSAIYVSSVAISASASNAAQIAAIWTNGTNPNYNVAFASVPIQIVWSPYSTPSLPWDGNGLAPYGQYFSNLGEYVSPSTGMLTIRQTDLSVHGRGLNLEIARVYTEPYSFLCSPTCQTYLYEPYPWAPLGAGWQLNFPWMSSSSRPQYLHVSDGQGYLIPLNFWNGLTATFENHQGENFKLVRLLNGTIFLYDKAGTAYNFGITPNHALMTITDSAGNNTITFNYSNNLISCISDTVNRAFSFTYSGGFLQKISQINGTCANPGSTIRSITYVNNAGSLVSVTDPANRVTSFTPGSNQWLVSQISYPTGWYDSYTYTQRTLGTTALTYRVSLQQIMASPTSTIRQFAYSYTQPTGDQVTGSTITSYNGTQIAGYTKYAFSFLAVIKNVTDTSGKLLSGDEQFFGVNGEIPKDVVMVSDGQGHIGSYTNYFRYDFWGNQIYSRQSINPSTGSSHDTFNAYYNNGEPPGFLSFQDSFSSNQGNAPDNSWNVTAGSWLVSNGVYNGTETVGAQENMFSWTDNGQPNLSLQAQVYVAKQLNSSNPRVGILTHFPKSGSFKWGLVFYSGGLYLLDDLNVWLAGVSCPMIMGVWYTMNMTVNGYAATGWASTQGQTTCTVSGIFPTNSPAAGGTAFGLYAGGYSALFDNVLVATVSPSINGLGFSNSFVQTGAPGPIGLNAWLTTTKPPGSGWNTSPNWLPASTWGQAYASQNYGGTPWGTITIPTLVTLAQNNCPSGPSQCSVTFTATAGDELIVSFQVPGLVCGVSGPSVSDTRSNTYTNLSYNGSSDIDLGIFVARSGSSGSDTTTVNCPTGSTLTTTVAEYSGVTGIGSNVNSAQLVSGFGTFTSSVNMTTSASSAVYESLAVNDASVGVTCSSESFTPQNGQSETQGTCVTYSQLYFINEWNSAPNAGTNHFGIQVSGGCPTFPCKSVHAAVELLGGQVSTWPDNNAQWIWWDANANVSASKDSVWFRRVFSLPTTTGINLTIAADNSYVLYLDGLQLGSGSVQPGSYAANLGPGSHVLGIYTTNPDGPDPAGLLVSAKNTATAQVIFRSDATAGPQIGALAGTAQLQGGIGSVPMETYYSYYSWGGLNQTRQVYESGPISLVFTSEKDTGGNWNLALTSNPISVVPNEGIVIVSQLSVICCSINDPPGHGPCDVVISDTLGITFAFVASTYSASNGGVGQCLWGGIARSSVTGTITQSAFGYSAMQIFGYSNVAGFGTTAAIGTPYSTSGFPYTVDLPLTLQNSKSSIVGFTEAGRACTTGATFTFTPQSAGLKQEQTESYAGFVGAFYCGTNQTVAYYGDGEDIVNPSVPNTVLHYSTTISSNMPNGYFSAVAVELIPITTPSSPQWITASRTYDRYANPASVVDARGNYTYFNFSTLYQNAYLTNQTQTLKPGSTKITRLNSYNFTTGTMLSAVDPNGYNTTYQYDILGRQIRVNSPNGLGFTAYSYNDQANYIDITNENGWHTRQIYDGLGRLAITENFLGSNKYNQTDQFNWQNKMTMNRDPLGNTYNYTYDALGRIATTTKPDRTTVSQFYNDTASWVRLADENGNYKCSVYDRLNRLVSVVENASSNCQTGIVSNYYYDEVGDLTQATNANQKSTTYTYDNLGRPIQVIFPDGTTQSYSYDIGGNAVKKVDQKQFTTLYSYDSLNRPSTVSYCGPPVTTTTISSASYTYDKNGNLVKLQNKNTTLTYTYDARGRTLSEKYAVNTNATTINLGCVGTRLPTTSGASLTYTVRYGYSGEVLANMTYPDGLVLKYAYDSLGRPLNVSKSGSSTSYAKFTYYNCPCASRIKGINFGDGTVANYTYDSLTRPSTIKVVAGATLLLNLSYIYGHTGTVSSITGKLNGASINEQYTYDQLNRVIGATLNDGGTTNTFSYKYDRVGNRLNQTLNGATTGYTINPANNELTASSVTGTTIAYSYDANGNLATQNVTTRGTIPWSYAWTFSNQLIQVSNNHGVQGTYAYDGTGRRAESVESSTTFYAYFGTETLYESVVGGATNDFVYEGYMRIAKVSGSIVNYYHSDALGSTRLVTTSGMKGVTVVFSDNYQPYGKDNGTPTGSETYKFTGKPYSQAVGLYYLYQRWYDPSVGRFVSQDLKPGDLSNPESFNLYVYVQDRPTTQTDQTGQCPNCVLAAVGAVAGGVIAYAACAAGDGWRFSLRCLEIGLVGAAVGALAGFTFGASLSAIGGGGLGAFVLAGGISGAISGFAEFDLKAILGLDGRDLGTLEKDVVEGAVAGAIGGAIACALGCTLGDALKPLEEQGAEAVYSFAQDWEQAGAKDAASAAARFGPRALQTIGFGVQVGQAILGGAVGEFLKKPGAALVYAYASQARAIGTLAYQGFNSAVQYTENFVNSGEAWLAFL